MFNIILRIIRLAKQRKKYLLRGIFASSIEAIMIKFPIFIILLAFIKIVANQFVFQDIIFLSLILFLVLFIGIIMNYIENFYQMGIGYEIFADERIALGDKIKKYSMGYFSKGNLGNLSAVITSDIKFIEEFGMMQIGKVIAALLSLIIMTIFMFFISVNVALVALIITFITYYLFSHLQKVAKDNSYATQAKQKDVVDCVIEYIKGMQVIKAFNLMEKTKKESMKNLINLKLLK